MTKSNLLIFPFVELLFLDVESENSLPSPKYQRLSPVLFFESFIASHFTFKTLIPVQVNFVQMWGLGQGLFLFIYLKVFNCSSTMCGKGCPFCIELLSCLCQKSVGHIPVSISGVSISLYWSEDLSHHHCLHHCRLTVSFKIW